MKKVFIAGPYLQKKDQHILEGIQKTLSGRGYKTFIGAKDIDNYGKVRMPRPLFWKRIVNKIRNSDVIIINMRSIGTGFGRVIEAGVARSFDKKIISYKTLEDLQKKLKIIKI
jgi:nucleoside 2-deoxyribosyltransferase